jgi:hyperosmotically inducible protein
MKRFDKIISAAFLAVTLVSAGGCASTASHQSTGEYFDDTVITTKVKTAIVEDPLTKVLDIKVTTYNGEVQLSGFVSSQAEADRAVELARGVEGVKSVKNDMQMK